MDKIKVWYYNSLFGREVCFTIGEAKDFGNGIYEEGVLYYEGDLKSLLQQNPYAYCFHMGYLCNRFYLSKQSALEKAKLAESAWVEEFGEFAIYEYHVESQRYFPVEFPVTATLVEGERGLLCRLNMRPDIDGKKPTGKIYFPDRSCAKDLCVGPAVITEILDRGNYGFFKAHMQQFEAPSDEEVSLYVIRNGLYDRKVNFCSNRFGNFVIIDEICLIRGSEGVITSYSPLGKYDPKVTVKESILAKDLVCQGYQGCNFDDLVNKFGEFMFDSYKANNSSKFISKLVDKAVRFGFISIKSIYNVDFVDVNTRYLEDAIDQFSREEMAEIAEACHELNEKANEAIRSKIRKGKIQLNLKVHYRGY